MDAFCFRSVFNRLPEYVISNAVNELCEPLGAIRIIPINGHSNNVYVDVKNWLHKGFEIRDRLIALRAKGRFDKSEIPQIPLKFGRYLLVLPSYTLRQHEEYLVQKEKEETEWRHAQQTVHTIPFQWQFDGPVSMPISWGNPDLVPEFYPDAFNEAPLAYSDDGTTASEGSTASPDESLRGYMAGIEFD